MPIYKPSETVGGNDRASVPGRCTGDLRGRAGHTFEVMDRATEIRAQYGFKTPDAIHLAAAVVSGCDVFLTNDHRLDRFSDITVEVIQP